MAEKGGKKSQSGRIEERARELCEPIITAAGYELWDVCFEKEGAMWYLRILFDGKDGLDSDTVGEITEPINKICDKQDFISYVDILEVGSPGLSKKLRRPEHYRACIGEKIKATVRDEKGKEVAVPGILEAYDEENGVITVDGQEIQLSKCVKVNSDL